MNYYDLLGVPPTATTAEIRAAYRTLAQIFHPDRLAHLTAESRSFAEERLKALNVAYGVLHDPGKRAAYDATLSGPLPRPRVGYQPPPPPRPQPQYTPPQSPPPTGTTTVATSGKSSTISSATVACPATTSAWSKGGITARLSRAAISSAARRRCSDVWPA